MSVVEAFHRQYYESRVWQGRTTWLGLPVAKTPMDLWIYQEIIHRTKPDLIIECGTYTGGSALYMAAICDLIGSGTVSVSTSRRRRRRGIRGCPTSLAAVLTRRPFG